MPGLKAKARHGLTRLQLALAGRIPMSWWTRLSVACGWLEGRLR